MKRRKRDSSSSLDSSSSVSLPKGESDIEESDSEVSLVDSDVHLNSRSSASGGSNMSIYEEYSQPCSSRETRTKHDEGKGEETQTHHFFGDTEAVSPIPHSEEYMIDTNSQTSKSCNWETSYLQLQDSFSQPNEEDSCDFEQDGSDSSDDEFLDCVEDDESWLDSSDSGPDFSDWIASRNDPPVFKGCPITLGDSFISILSFVTRHKLSGKAINDLLKLIKLHCGIEENCLQDSIYFFKKYFSDLTLPVKFIYFCSACYALLETEHSQCSNFKEHPEGTIVNYFVEISLISQIQKLYEMESFFNNLQHRSTRQKKHISGIEDIYDGQLYKEHIESGFLAEDNPFHFSLTWNSDGVPVYFSSNRSLWPIFFSVNELPYKLRTSKEYTLVGGLWFGRKPVGNLLLQPFISSLKQLKKGFEVQPFGFKHKVTAKGILLAGTCDLPAKAMFLGMMQFNGSYGCHICKHPGGSVYVEPPKKGGVKKFPDESQRKKKSVWVYTYSDALDLRNHAETVQYADKALTLASTPGKECQVFGVKHPSVLFKIMPDTIRGMGIDDLHTLFLGGGKKFMSLWTDSKYKPHKFCVASYIKLIDKRLMHIRPPNFVQRSVSSIETNYSNWKASDLKNWILYYSIPVMEGILPDKYIENYIDMVSSIYILLSDSILPNDLLNCQKILKTFVKDYELLYGEEHMTMTIHLLLHLTFVVNNLGPMWTMSCFPYESLNGELLKMIHGTRYVETQLVSSAFVVLQLQHRINSLKSETAQNYCKQILHPSLKLKKLDNIEKHMFSVGYYKPSEQIPFTSKEALTIAGTDVSNCVLEEFFKLQRGSHLFVSRRNTRVVKSVSYTASFFDSDGVEKYGEIDSFVKISCLCETHCTCQAKYFAIFQVGSVQSYSVGSKLVPHMLQFSLKPQFIAVPTHNLGSLLFQICVDASKCIICKPVNCSQSE